ncbi:hypothetical protein OIE69_44465 (plasmid) [Actinacidiphila glaucinigra]|uniref:hypothetical protein n=1 Tax=Actinacidiphila glaucinigra TaxID=235986 RepID=UPI002DD7CCA9|nr:hypothetical protein [Actinacidiphila glaucinigra]WSD65752.1 hypothetical protein OIE69_43385 [Actinacidiphila glaucinigra]WSD65960.1 hypothetical protein OIE69_44465 [Actinacidiphila glaucinigra]
MSSSGKSRGAKDLARRRAALERVQARLAEERRAAEEAEQARRLREASLDELAADFELAQEDAGRIAEEVEAEVRRVRARGEERMRQARLQAAQVVVAMGEAGETVVACGRRLGVSAERVKELRRLAREAGGDGGPGVAGVAADQGGGVARSGTSRGQGGVEPVVGRGLVAGAGVPVG